jgi:two-component system phosphate regulon sensor histidine kinase PhoR
MGAAVRAARLQQDRRRLEDAEAAARAVAAEREQAAHVLDAVGYGIFLLDHSGVVRLWNSAASLVTTLPANEVVGRRLVDFVPAWDGLAGRIPVADEGAMARSVTLPLELGGGDVWLSFVAVRTSAGLVYAFRDVTLERRLQEDKSDFVATISHELRTPMTAVYGAAQTLLRHDLDLSEAERRVLLEMIGTQAARLSEITEDVLLTTRLDRDELRVEHEVVDVAEVVRSTVEAMRSHIPREVHLELVIDDDVGPASGDSDRIQQVLVNLIDNAAKYGASPVQVSAAGVNGVVRIEVADAGPGVPAADRERVFEKFYRSGPQTTRAAGGTGLGLYISRELIERMGGRLRVDSEARGGATFVVELPVTT